MKKLLDERFMTWKSKSHGTWLRWNRPSRAAILQAAPRCHAPFAGTCQTCTPWILLSPPNFQSPNHLLDKRIVWKLKTKVSRLPIFFVLVLHDQESSPEAAGALLPFWSHSVLHSVATVRSEKVYFMALLAQIYPHLLLSPNSSSRPKSFFMTWQLPVSQQASIMGHLVHLAPVPSFLLLGTWLSCSPK